MEWKNWQIIPILTRLIAAVDYFGLILINSLLFWIVFRYGVGIFSCNFFSNSLCNKVGLSEVDSLRPLMFREGGLASKLAVAAAPGEPLTNSSFMPTCRFQTETLSQSVWTTSCHIGFPPRGWYVFSGPSRSSWFFRPLAFEHRPSMNCRCSDWFVIKSIMQMH